MNIYKELRKGKNLTQKQLSQILFLDQTTVSKWELGKATPDYGTLQKLADFYGVTTDLLLNRTNTNLPDIKKTPIADVPPSDIVTEKFIDEFKDLFSEKTFRQYALLYRAMDRDTRIFVLGYICSYLKSVGMNTEKVLK